ncbi:hypothetical protein ASPZODRAFT_128937 [Penicilliopsis zonata CBS 506.65]|uniref:ASST-domain-containing protein n=1 Tax=Penicilliopsis zonata CBS 506.65 TaxID=1073090 RepID=A0A1L9ST81_9EURO|nr:hypothetical protein ASPZODRAFT_128937 [Penicilliopsis zonata CBS 506.65]OJJ50321.1 hypothetical protein ASPZODRAFT_128937 [Penicilliopsis zonata CBS 506.65]
MSKFSLYSLVGLLVGTYAYDWPTDGSDLQTFVTMPDVYTIQWNITHYDRERAAPGYWFIAPYATYTPEPASKIWQPHQVGSQIYDSDGELVWVHMNNYDGDNRNEMDFRVQDGQDGEKLLTMIVKMGFNSHKSGAWDKGTAIIMNDRYEVIHRLHEPDEFSEFNAHEFQLTDGGRSALATPYWGLHVPLTDWGRPEEESWVAAGGIIELDVTDSAVLFQWNSINHIPLSESVHLGPETAIDPQPNGLDYIHVNSVDKLHGNYLLSSRFTSTIYCISGIDKQILWRLGGKFSDFTQDFTFSKQHHARFISGNDTHTVISFMNNASDDWSNDEPTSSAMYVQLNTVTMTATVLHSYPRPDGQLSRMRGSNQLLPNGNVFVSWSEDGYQSEFAEDGTLLMEARFSSKRFNTYRAFKHEWVGRPTYPPTLVAHVHGTGADTGFTTVFHISWNGATEVKLWRFFARDSQSGDPVYIGNATRSGFETIFTTKGYLDWVCAEAINAQGISMGWSKVSRSRFPDLPRHVSPADYLGVTPDDPTVLYAKSSATSSSSNHFMKTIESIKNTQPTQTTTLYIALAAITLSGLTFLVLLFKNLPFFHRRKYQLVRSDEEGSIHSN